MRPWATSVWGLQRFFFLVYFYLIINFFCSLLNSLSLVVLNSELFVKYIYFFSSFVSLIYCGLRVQFRVCLLDFWSYFFFFHLFLQWPPKVLFFICPPSSIRFSMCPQRVPQYFCSGLSLSFSLYIHICIYNIYIFTLSLSPNIHIYYI